MNIKKNSKTLMKHWSTQSSKQLVQHKKIVQTIPIQMSLKKFGRTSGLFFLLLWLDCPAQEARFNIVQAPLYPHVLPGEVIVAAEVLPTMQGDSSSKKQLEIVSNEVSGLQLNTLTETLPYGSNFANNVGPITNTNSPQPPTSSSANATTPIGHTTPILISGQSPELINVSQPEKMHLEETKVLPPTTVIGPRSAPISGHSEEETTDIEINRSLGIALGKWRRAWSRGDVAAYLGLYAPSFSPANKVNLDTWKKKRTAALADVGDVTIDITDLSLYRSNNEQASMEFTQTYKSKKYSDRVYKTLDWINVEGRWLIVNEAINNPSKP